MPIAQIRKFQNSSLSRESRPWGREVEERIKELERAAARGDSSDLNANKAQNSSIDLVSRNIVDLDQRVQDAINTITIDTSQVTSGVFTTARIPNIDQSTVLNAWTKDVNNVPGSVYANLFASNVTTNITATRVGNWARISDGFIATATSSERKKTNIRPIEWPMEKLEAVMGMALVYYEWIAAVELKRYIDGLPEDHPRFGEYVAVHQEIGFIAERMHEAGLWEFVVYRHHADDTLVLKNGKPIPFSIHYTNWALALHAVVQHLWAARKTDRADLDLVMKTLGLTSTAEIAE